MRATMLFGKNVTAPADGIVTEVINDIPDNTPVGVMNEKEPQAIWS